MAKTHPIIEFTDDELALEEWRPIAGTNDLMFVSSLGRVRSHLRCPGGRIRVQTIANRYYSVGVRVGRGRPTRRVHSLVAEAFLGPRPPGAEINHKDCNRLNNRVTNLEWVTRDANREHYRAYRALRTGKDVGAYRDSGNAKLTPESVGEIRAKRSRGMGISELAREHGVSPTAISFVLSGRTWSWV